VFEQVPVTKVLSQFLSKFFGFITYSIGEREGRVGYGKLMNTNRHIQIKVNFTLK